MNANKFSITVSNGLAYPFFLKHKERDQISHAPTSAPVIKDHITISFSFTCDANNSDEARSFIEKYFESNQTLPISERRLTVPSDIVIYSIDVRYQTADVPEGHAIIVGDHRLIVEPVTYDVDGETVASSGNVNSNDFSTNISMKQLDEDENKYLPGRVSYEYYNYTNRPLFIWVSHDTPIDCPPSKTTNPDLKGRLVRVQTTIQRKTAFKGNVNASTRMAGFISGGRGKSNSDYCTKLLRELSKGGDDDTIAPKTINSVIIEDVDFIDTELVRVETFNVVISSKRVSRISVILFNKKSAGVNEVCVTHTFYTNDKEIYPALYGTLAYTEGVTKLVGIPSDETKIVITNSDDDSEVVIESKDFEARGWFETVSILKNHINNAKKEAEHEEADRIRKVKELEAKLALTEANIEKIKADIKGASHDNKAKKKDNKHADSDRKYNRKKEKKKGRREKKNDKANRNYKNKAGDEREAKAKETDIGNKKSEGWFAKTMEVLKTVASVITAAAAAAWAVFRFIL